MITNINPNDVTLYEKNAKYHPAVQVNQIAESIKRFGFRQPIVVDKNNVVVIGHGRVLAARQLGLTEVPCERADDLTDEQIRALRLADNRTNESKWKERALKFELLELAPSIDLSSFGFDMPEIAAPTGWQGDTYSENNIPPQREIRREEYSGEGAYEYKQEDFGDEQFQCQCPECGFRFNP